MSGVSGKFTRVGAALLALILLLLTSCAQIPRSGPVGKSTDESAGNPNAPVFFPAAPRPGAGPEAVIEDFYLAGSGYEDDYAVARQYLTQAFVGDVEAGPAGARVPQGHGGGHRRRKCLQLPARPRLFGGRRRRGHAASGGHHRKHPRHR